MYNKKSKIAFIIAFSAMVLMTGCAGKNNTEETKNTATQQSVVEDVEQENTAKKGITGYDFPDVYQKTEGCVVADFEVKYPKSLKAEALYSCKAELISYDAEKVKKVFGDDLDTEALDFNETGEMLNVDTSWITYVTKLGTYYGNSVQTDWQEGNLEKYAIDTDLEFMTRQQAYENIKDLLEEMGVSVGECEYTCYALDMETLKQEERPIDSNGNLDKGSMKPEWTKGDEGYYFSIRQKTQGVKEYHPYGEVFAKPSPENAPIQVYYSKNGIERLELEKVFTFTAGEKEMELQSFDTIMETVTKRFNDIITDATYLIKEGELYYKTPSFGKDAMPVWVFQIEEQAKDGAVYSINLVVDAQTGKELPMEGTY